MSLPNAPNHTFAEQDGDLSSVAVNIRDGAESDRRFLEHMFIEAVLWDPAMKRQGLDSLLLVPELRRYFVDWGRPGDLALIGFVEESVPELGIAVLADWRGRSIGTTPLGALLRIANARGCLALSLSVAEGNPAGRLYERHGFVKVRETGASWTMLRRLS